MFVGKVSIDLVGQRIVASWFECVAEETFKLTHNTSYKAGDEQKIEEELGEAYKAILAGFKPITVTPEKVTMRQTRLVLLKAGLLDSVENLLTDAEHKISWEYATEVYRNSGLVREMQTALNLTSEQVDNLFIEASKL